MTNPELAPEGVTEIPAPTAPEDVPEEKKLTPLKAIRLKCLDCCYDSEKEVRLCVSEDCPHWPFRFGKNPFRKKKTLTEQQKLEHIARLNNVRECRAIRLSLIDKHRADFKKFIIHSN